MHYPTLFSLSISGIKKQLAGCLAPREDVRKDSSQSFFANQFFAFLGAFCISAMKKK
jgi:hypothetical protein